MKTFVSLNISNGADFIADGAVTLDEVNDAIARFAAKGIPFTVKLGEPCSEAIDIRLAEEGGEGEPDESMDGDHQSALASIGWGDDEDYRPGMDVDEAEIELHEQFEEAE
jgi:hypothetical protein